jgi:hypothetical protein
MLKEEVFISEIFYLTYFRQFVNIYNWYYVSFFSLILSIIFDYGVKKWHINLKNLEITQKE